MATIKTNYGEDVTGSTIGLNDLSSAGVNWNDLYTTVTTGTGGYTFNNITTSASPWIAVNDGTSTLSVTGDADIGGDIKVKGRSLAEFMDSVEQRLNMLQPNPKLEQEWNQLRELGEQYRQLERELAEKSKMWQTLKK
jgi:hypothetical protein